MEEAMFALSGGRVTVVALIGCDATVAEHRHRPEPFDLGGHPLRPLGSTPCVSS